MRNLSIFNQGFWLGCSSLLVTLAMTPNVSATEINERKTLPDSAQIQIENMRGQVTLTASADRSVSVTGTLDPLAERFEFEQRGNTLYIVVKMPSDRRSWNDEPGSDLRITIPANTTTNFAGVSSNISASGIVGDLALETISGDVEVDNSQGSLRLSSISGDVESRGNTGTANFQTVSGEVSDRQSTYTEAKFASVSGEVEVDVDAKRVSVEAVSGDIELRLAATEQLQIRAVSGDISIATSLLEGGSIRGNSVSGNVVLALYGELNAELDLSTNAGGDIRNQLSPAAAEKAKYGPARWLQTRVGEGAGSINVTTVSGDIVLTRK